MSEFPYKRVLITGGAGFIGSEVTRQLLEQGAFVTVVDSLRTGKLSNLPTERGDSLQFVQGDVRDHDLIQRLVGGVDAVFHLACLGVRHSIHSPLENHSVNADGTLAVLEASRKHDVSRFVHVSSSEVYGAALRSPMDELHPTLPHTVYGAGKLAGEANARAYGRTYGLPVVIIRPFNAYGPRSHHEGDSGEVIPKFVLRAMADQSLTIFGDGRQTRDFTYVADTARAIIQASVADAAIGETINVGSGREISVIDLAELVGKVLDRQVRVVHVQPRPGDVARLIADSGKARDLLGFTPEVSFSDGLRRLIDWYRAEETTPEVMLADEVELNWLGRQ